MIGKTILYIFILISLFAISGCNLCPTSPVNEGLNPDIKIYCTLIPLNSNSPIITEIDIENFSFNVLEDNGYLFSAPASNGNFAFVRINETESKKYLMMGNIINKTVQITEKESQDFSIFNPIISKSGNQIAFLGGSNQLFLWVYNPTNNSSYLDKISGKVFNNILPSFSSDGTNLAFVEKINDNLLQLKIINSLNTDQIVYTKEIEVTGILTGIDNYLTFSKNNKIAILIQEETDDKLVVIDILENSIKTIVIAKKKLGIKIAKISPDGKYIAVTANDGNIWLINISENEPLFNQISNVSFCNSFIYIDWNKKGYKLLAQSYNCNDDVTKGSTLYLINLIEDNNNLIYKNKQMICNNIQRAFWSN